MKELVPHNFLYLAAPYTGPRSVVLTRFHAINCAAAQLLKKGYLVFSPISHSHPIFDCDEGLRGDFEFWQNFDMRMVKAVDALAILQLDGWTLSQGVKIEIRLAKTYLKPIYTVDPITYELSDFK